MAAGVELLKEHGKPSATDLFLFDLPESPYAREKLRAALLGINGDAKKEVNAVRSRPARVAPVVQDRIQEAAAARSLRGEPGTDLPEHSLPEKLRPRRRELVQWHNELKFLRGRLLATPNGMELRELADRIVSLRKKITAGWLVIETWRATGDVTLDPDPASDHAALIKERLAIRVRLSEHKHGKRVLNEAVLADKTQRLAAIDLILNGPA